MSDENENNNAVTEDHKNGEMLVHYNDDESYNSAITGFREELDKQIVFAGESTDWREIRKRLSDLRDKLKTLFLKSEDDKQINELIQSTLENINLRQNEEQEKFDRMLRGIPKVADMETTKVEKTHFEDLFSGKASRIPIPEFEGYAGNGEKVRQKFIAKLQSLGFDISTVYNPRAGGPDKEYVLNLRFIEEFDDKFYVKTG